MAVASDTLSLVPPRRLGQLLVGHRTAAGLSVAQVAARSPILPDVRTVEDLEAGRFRLTDGELTVVSAAYGVELAALVPQRAVLVVDLDRRVLTTGGHRIAVPGRRRCTDPDDVLSQYLALVRTLRNLPVDADVALRRTDLGALSAALVMPAVDVERRLHELMEAQPAELRERARWLSGRPLVPALGILVGLTAVGSLILTSPVPAGPSSKAPTVPVTAVVDTPTEQALPTRIAVSSVTASTAGVDAAARTAAEGEGPAAATAAPAASSAVSATLRDEVLALIPFPWEERLPGWTISFEEPRPGFLGMTIVSEQRLVVYPRPGQTTEEVAFTLAHEMGHAVDLTYNDDADRARWRAARNLAVDHPWFAGDAQSDFEVGAGDFAESFAYWQLGGGVEMSELGGPPDAAQLDLLAELSLR